VKYMRFVRFVLVATFLALLVVPCLCADQVEPQYGGILRWAIYDIPANLDAQRIIRGIGTEVLAFDKLISHTEEAGYQPELLSSWEIVDSTTYIFNIREGVLFHDGSEFTAEVLRWNLERLKSDISRYKSDFDIIDTITVLDEYTVEIHLAYPFAPFLDNMAARSYMVSKTAVETLGDEEFQKNPVGTGAFKFVSRDLQRETVTFERFDDYFKGRPYLDGITVTKIPDEQTRAAAFSMGDFDYMYYPPDAEVERLSRTATVLSVLGINNAMNYITFNCEQPPFDDVRVRTAFALAIDENQIVQMIANTEPIPGPVSAKNWGHNPEVPETFYNPDRARELLAEAGYADGLEVTLKTRSNYGYEIQVAEIAQNMLAQIGVRVRVESLESATLLSQMRGDEEWQFATLRSGGGGKLDPNGNMRSIFSPYGGSNWISNYENPSVTALLEAGTIITDQEARAIIYQTAEKMIFDDHPMVWWGKKVQVAVAQPYVHGITYQATGYYFQAADIWMEAH